MGILHDTTTPATPRPKIVETELKHFLTARLAQSVEHETLNLRVVGSSPTLGEHFIILKPIILLCKLVKGSYGNYSLEE